MGRGVLLGAQREQPVLRSAFNLVPRAAPPEYHAATREKRAKKGPTWPYLRLTSM